MKIRELIYRRLSGEFSYRTYFRNLKNIKIGESTKIRKGAKIIANGKSIKLGKNCYVDYNVIFSCNGGRIEVGDRTSFNPNCVIYGHGDLKIGNDVRIAANTVIIPANHGYDDIKVKICDQDMIKKGIIIENNIWIGTGVTILDGVTVGEGSVIGAGSVVTKNVPSYHVVAGVPARVIKKR